MFPRRCWRVWSDRTLLATLHNSSFLCPSLPLPGSHCGPGSPGPSPGSHSLHQVHLRSQRNTGVVEEAIVFKRKVARSVCLKCAAGGGVNILQISTCPPARNMSHGGSHHFHEDNLKYAPTSTWWPRLRVFGNQPL